MNCNSKLLSIIIPTYNMEAYLNRCLDSLLITDEDMSQCIEVLVVNDGSKDASSQIAHTYQDRFPDVFLVIDKENGNYGSCINAGLKVASGKYIKILDADDYFDNGQFTSYFHQLSIIDADLVVTNTRGVSDSGTLSETAFSEEMSGKTFTLNNLTFDTPALRPLVAMHCITVKREVLQSNHYVQHEGISYTDTEWTFACFAHAATVQFVNVCLYQYYLGREGQTMSIDALIRRQDDLYENAINVLASYHMLYTKLSDMHRATALTPLLKLLSVYFKVAVVCQPSTMETKRRVNTIIEGVKAADLTMRNFYKHYLWKGIPYVWLYHKVGLSLHPIYKSFKK